MFILEVTGCSTLSPPFPLLDGCSTLILLNITDYYSPSCFAGVCTVHCQPPGGAVGPLMHFRGAPLPHAAPYPCSCTGMHAAAGWAGWQESDSERWWHRYVLLLRLKLIWSSSRFLSDSFSCHMSQNISTVSIRRGKSESSRWNWPSMRCARSVKNFALKAGMLFGTWSYCQARFSCTAVRTHYSLGSTSSSWARTITILVPAKWYLLLLEHGRTRRELLTNRCACWWVIERGSIFWLKFLDFCSIKFTCFRLDVKNCTSWC